MRFITDEKDVELVMWEKTLMPKSIPEKDATGKTVFKKQIGADGKPVMDEMTTYTFRDGFGDKLVMLSKNNDYRKLERAKVKLVIEIKKDEFAKGNINKISLAELVEIKK